MEIHHLDHNEENDDEDNLVPLCYTHHMRAKVGIHHNPRLEALLLKIVEAEREDLETLHEIAQRNMEI